MQHNLTRMTSLVVLMSIAVVVNASGNYAGGHDHSGAAVGEPGNATRITRTVYVNMTDTMRSMPVQITIRHGETICFGVINSGQVRHEMMLGMPADLVAHAEQTRKHPEMEHADVNVVTVDPGQRGEIIRHFTHAGSIEFACL